MRAKARGWALSGRLPPGNPWPCMRGSFNCPHITLSSTQHKHRECKALSAQCQVHSLQYAQSTATHYLVLATPCMRGSVQLPSHYPLSPVLFSIICCFLLLCVFGVYVVLFSALHLLLCGYDGLLFCSSSSVAVWCCSVLSIIFCCFVGLMFYACSAVLSDSRIFKFPYFFEMYGFFSTRTT